MSSCQGTTTLGDDLDVVMEDCKEPSKTLHPVNGPPQFTPLDTKEKFNIVIIH